MQQEQGLISAFSKGENPHHSTSWILNICKSQGCNNYPVGTGSGSRNKKRHLNNPPPQPKMTSQSMKSDSLEHSEQPIEIIGTNLIVSKRSTRWKREKKKINGSVMDTCVLDPISFVHSFHSSDHPSFCTGKLGST